MPSACNPDAAADPAPQNAPNFPTPESDGSPILTDERPETGLTPKQRLAIAALVCGRTFSSAAIQAGVDRGTLFRWRRLPAFQKAVDELSREALEATAVRARNLMLKATRTLGEALGGDERFAWAIRIANSKRLWELGQMPRPSAADADAEDPFAMPPTAGGAAGSPNVAVDAEDETRRARLPQASSEG